MGRHASTPIRPWPVASVIGRGICCDSQLASRPRPGSELVVVERPRCQRLVAVALRTSPPPPHRGAGLVAAERPRYRRLFSAALRTSLSQTHLGAGLDVVDKPSHWALN